MLLEILLLEEGADREGDERDRKDGVILRDVDHLEEELGALRWARLDEEELLGKTDGEEKVRREAEGSSLEENDFVPLEE